MAERKTRIVATVGPASASPARLARLVRAGVDVFRLNFSHGTPEFFRQVVADVREVSSKLGQPVALLQDLCGPKMRVGRLEDDSVPLASGREVTVVEGDGLGTRDRIFVEAAGALGRLQRGQPFRLADGLIELRVESRLADGVATRVIHGGVLRSRQGVSIPGAALGSGAGTLTRKDRGDLALGLELGVDAVALSFVRSADDVLALRRVLARHEAQPFVIAKIERAEALDNLDAILEVVGGVMVARGDLGVELGVEKVPMAQRRIIEAARAQRRPVITATQMLESMIERPTPTRAEVSDVANAVLAGTDALMLSGETAVGRYPVEAVRVLDSVAREVEGEATTHPEPVGSWDLGDDVPQAITRAARLAARAVGAAAVLGFTNSGRTVRLVSSQRPRRRVYGFTHNPSTYRRMKFFWGVTPLLIPRATTVEGMIGAAEDLLVKRRLVRKGDHLVLVCGEQVHTGATNSLRIHTIGAAPRPARVRKPAQERRRQPR